MPLLVHFTSEPHPHDAYQDQDPFSRLPECESPDACVACLSFPTLMHVFGGVACARAPARPHARTLASLSLADSSYKSGVHKGGFSKGWFSNLCVSLLQL